MTKTDVEALQYAIDWLRAFPVLPTQAAHVREERAAVVAQLEVMAARAALRARPEPIDTDDLPEPTL